MKGGKKGRLINLHLTSEAVVYDLFVYYFDYTVAIASRVFLSGAGVWIFYNKNLDRNWQCAKKRVFALSRREGFGWISSYVTSTQSRRVATVYSDVRSHLRTLEPSLCS